MSKAPVMGLTDELVAELEALANECGQHGANWYQPRHMAAFPEYSCDQDFVVAASPATILALLAERAELKRDAERYRWLIKHSTYGINCRQRPELTIPIFAPDHSGGLDAAIDTAMQSEAKP